MTARGDPHRGADQAVRRDHRRRRRSTSTCARATSTASSAPTAPARPRRCGCCSAWCWPRPGRIELLGAADAAARPARCCRRSARWSRGRRRTRTCPGGANLALFDAMGRAAGGATRARPGRRGARAGRARRRRRAAGAGLLARHAAAARPGRRAAARSRGCWCSTSRPTASTRRASSEIRELLLELNAAGTTVFLSSHLLAEIEQMCTRVGVLDRGRLVLQDAARRAAAADRPRRRAHPRRRRGARRCSTGVVEEHDGERLLVRARRRRPRSTPGWSRAGVRVTELARRAAHASRTSCSRRPTASGDRFGAER